MRKTRRKPADLISDILHEGIRAILIIAAMEIVLIAVSFAVGAWMWSKHGFFPGLGMGMATFVFGQIPASLILDIILMLPERTEVNESVPSDKEVLEALKADLGTTVGEDPHSPRS